MTNEQLQQWVEELSERYFGVPFRHQATFNHRLSSTGGRYFSKSHNIDIAWKQYEVHGEEEVEKIIKHELCHYHLHLAGRGYKHRDPEFKALLTQVGGSRYCRPVVEGGSKTEPYRYRVICMRCSITFPRKRKVNVNKYVCGKCKGRLKLEPFSP